MFYTLDTGIKMETGPFKLNKIHKKIEFLWNRLLEFGKNIAYLKIQI